MNRAEKEAYRQTQEWKDYMNSPEVVEAHRKLVVQLREYKEKRREFHERTAAGDIVG